MHHYTSGLKSLYTGMAFAGMDVCRQACGGVGFSQHSAIPDFLLNYAPVVSLEGDNTVMAKQNFSYIQKLLKNIAKGKKATGLFSYMNNLE
jgi:hypothetical protein